MSDDELRAAATRLKETAEEFISLHGPDDLIDGCNCPDECLMPYWTDQVNVANAVLNQGER